MQGALALNSGLGKCLPAQRTRQAPIVPFAFKAGPLVAARRPAIARSPVSTGRFSRLSSTHLPSQSPAYPNLNYAWICCTGAVGVSQASIVADAASSVVAPLPHELFVLGEGLETPIQLIYLLTLLGFLSVGAYLVVRQVLIRRELDEGAKGLGERIRTGEATCEVGGSWTAARQERCQGEGFCGGRPRRKAARHATVCRSYVMTETNGRGVAGMATTPGAQQGI